MYGWLTLDDRLRLQVHLPDLELGTHRLISVADQQTRNQLVSKLVAPAFVNDATLRSAAYVPIQIALKHVTDGCVDYAIHAGIAFFLRHRDDHEAVRRAIGQTIDLEFGAIGSGAAPSMVAMSRRLKEVAFLLPENSRALVFNKEATRARSAIFLDDAAWGFAALRRAASQIENALAICPEDQRLGACSMAHQALVSAPACDADKVAVNILKTSQAGRFGIFEQLARRYHDEGMRMPLAHRHAALRRGFALASALTGEPDAEIADFVFAQAMVHARMEEELLMRDTIAAFDAGLKLGRLTEISLDALRRWRTQFAAANERIACCGTALDTEARPEPVRPVVRGPKATPGLQNRFMARLSAALAREPMRPGPQQGILLDCPMSPDDRDWVIERYHRRWCAGMDLVVDDGAPTRLDIDHAFALCVSDSRRRDCAFDISVRLWRREGDAGGLPSAAASCSEAFAPMDDAHWLDTRVACCLLHVPRQPCG